jgi:hypothetical protein
MRNGKTRVWSGFCDGWGLTGFALCRVVSAQQATVTKEMRQQDKYSDPSPFDWLRVRMTTFFVG